eukprot:CAMPEP_0198135060 /NCGR_PEP_ID=MMETSP1442-20131203/60395_1 /TAXON_ID= /ORGANISM="Craspedostauros australis, Strain CCMP3328" /LENGTH=445 /DNA_ID=CAMNT_0043796221 /DNA_START=321 /DNA_END=1658 /DNA_ORIENTATION=-
MARQSRKKSNKPASDTNVALKVGGFLLMCCIVCASIYQQSKITGTIVDVSFIAFDPSELINAVVDLGVTENDRNDGDSYSGNRNGNRNSGVNDGDRQIQLRMDELALQRLRQAHKYPYQSIPRTVHDYAPRHAHDNMAEHIITLDDIDKYMYQNPISFYSGMQEEPIIFFITPTYRRKTQMVDMMRIQAAMLADSLEGILAASAPRPPSSLLSSSLHNATAPRRTDRGLIYWIIVEDSHNCSKNVRHLLERSVGTIPFAHVAEPSPKSQPHSKRGRSQRNRGMSIVEEYFLANNRSGIVYFGDDDNGYHVQLFSEMRKIKRIGTMGVAFVGGATHERCQVNETTGKVDLMYTNWVAGRRFPIDMASFAFHTDLLKGKKPPRFELVAKPGMSEDQFMGLLIDDVSEFEPLGDNCTRVYTYHVKSDIQNRTERSATDPIAKEIEIGL